MLWWLLEYLCLVYKLGRALYRNLSRKVFKCGLLAVAFDMRVPARFHEISAHCREESELEGSTLVSHELRESE